MYALRAAAAVADTLISLYIDKFMTHIEFSCATQADGALGRAALAAGGDDLSSENRALRKQLEQVGWMLTPCLPAGVYSNYCNKLAGNLL